MAVVSCKSKSVLPHDGHEIYSVLEIRVRVACNIPKESKLIFWSDVQFSEQINIPSPKPSINKAPISDDEYSCKSS